jgi:hypothetical protein
MSSLHGVLIIHLLAVMETIASLSSFTRDGAFAAGQSLSCAVTLYLLIPVPDRSDPDGKGDGPPSVHSRAQVAIQLEPLVHSGR